MKISVLQWNIWTNEQPENILTLLKKIDADVICLQELTEKFPSTGKVDVPTFLTQGLDYNCHYVPAHTWPEEKGSKVQGNGILTKFPITVQGHEFVQVASQNSSLSYANEGRVVATATLKIGETSLQVATTHLSYSDQLIETTDKILEENNFLQVLSKIKLPLVITGDFNVAEDSHLITEMEKNYVHAGPAYNEKTWTTKPFQYHDFHEDALNWRLDYVFVTPNITVLKSEVIQTDFSDHLPILVELDI